MGKRKESGAGSSELYAGCGGQEPPESGTLAQAGLGSLRPMGTSLEENKCAFHAQEGQLGLTGDLAGTVSTIRPDKEQAGKVPRASV